MSVEVASAFSVEVGGRLLAVRQTKGWTLLDVERRSGWSASAVGSWERGARTLSVPRLHEVAAFYDIPVGVLLGHDENADDGFPCRVIFDLEALKNAPPAAAPVQRFARSITVARGDYAGRVLTVRHDDLKALCALVGANTPTAAVDQLNAWGVLT